MTRATFLAITWSLLALCVCTSLWAVFTDRNPLVIWLSGSAVGSLSTGLYVAWLFRSGLWPREFVSTKYEHSTKAERASPDN